MDAAAEILHHSYAPCVQYGQRLIYFCPTECHPDLTFDCNLEFPGVTAHITACVASVHTTVAHLGRSRGVVHFQTHCIRNGKNLHRVPIGRSMCDDKADGQGDERRDFALKGDGGGSSDDSSGKGPE